MLEMQTRVEIMQSDQQAWERERDQMQLDLAEAEALLDKLANDFKDQDCNFYGIQDEKDELEEQYDELIDTY